MAIITIEFESEKYLANKIIDYLVDVHEIKKISVIVNGKEIFNS